MFSSLYEACQGFFMPGNYFLLIRKRLHKMSLETTVLGVAREEGECYLNPHKIQLCQSDQKTAKR